MKCVICHKAHARVWVSIKTIDTEWSLKWQYCFGCLRWYVDKYYPQYYKVRAIRDDQSFEWIWE